MNPNYPDAANWRLRIIRYRLVGELCGGCGEAIFPPRDVHGCGWVNKPDFVRPYGINKPVSARDIQRKI